MKARIQAMKTQVGVLAVKTEPWFEQHGYRNIFLSIYFSSSQLM